MHAPQEFGVELACIDELEKEQARIHVGGDKSGVHDRPVAEHDALRAPICDEHARDEAADHVIDTVTRYAPNFRSAVIARSVLSPLDLEQRFGLIGGDIFHGQLTLDQLWSARPMLGYGAYRAPIAGLYMCGSGTHPGGGVTGLPGMNAAREILKDWPRRRR